MDHDALQLREQFDEAGLPFPDLSAHATAMQLVSPWHLTSRASEPAPPYLINEYVREFEDEDPEDYVVLAHAGHGTGSWAISYLRVAGPIGVFVQSEWGGAGTDPADEGQEIEVMAQRFEAADLLLSAPTDRLEDGQRLAVQVTDFGPTGWAVFRSGRDVEWTRSPTALADALAFLKG